MVERLGREKEKKKRRRVSEEEEEEKRDHEETVPIVSNSLFIHVVNPCV